MVFAGLAAAGCGSMPTPFTSLTEQEFNSLMQQNEFTIIDIRTPEEIAQGKIASDALEMDFYQASFPDQLAKLDKQKNYFLYCRSGNRSGTTLSQMKEMGFESVYDLQDGIGSWRGELEN